MKRILEKIARFLLPELFNTLEERARYTEDKVNQRVALLVSQIDPMEIVLRKYKASFLKEYRRAEEDLDEPSKIQMEMWGYRNHNDPCFKLMTEWIANKQGVFSFQHAKKPEDLLFGQASVITIEVLLKEVKRLSSLYEERIQPSGADADYSNTVEN